MRRWPADRDLAVSARPIAADSAGDFAPLRFVDVRDLAAGHEVDGRPDTVAEHERRGA
ncbi:MAG TPA: hypothetical protein VFG94_09385 [Acidimicrobiales bacterium]|nr:hypothetical protein [Acidimicrobiales bacterium]